MKSRTAILAFGALLWAAPALGQACAMCYSSAAGAPQEAQRALRRGVAVLIVPPVGFVTVGLGMAFRYSRKRDLEQR
jgi:hypothetical protein